MGYIDIVRKRASMGNSAIDILIETSPASIEIENYYSKELLKAIIVEDSSSDFVDEKILYTQPNALSEGKIIKWNEIDWILFQEQLTVEDKYDKFFILECSSKINFLIDGYKSKSHPVSFLKTSQGMKSTRASSRYIYTQGDSSIVALINTNSETEKLKEEDELIVNNSVWKIETINNYESNEVIVLGLNKVLKSNADDLDDNIANSDKEIGGNTYNDGTYEFVIVGDPTIKINSYKKYEVRKIDEDGNRIIPTNVSFSTTSDKIILTQNGKVATVNAKQELGEFTLRATADGKSISTKIKVIDLWG